MSEKKEEDFQPFQIGNAAPPRPEGDAGSPQSTAEVSNPDDTPQRRIFPNLEILIENEEFEGLGKVIGATRQKLDEIIQKRDGRAKAEAEKAQLAYEHTLNLIDHLREVKQNLLQNQTET